MRWEFFQYFESNLFNSYHLRLGIIVEKCLFRVLQRIKAISKMCAVNPFSMKESVTFLALLSNIPGYMSAFSSRYRVL